MRTLKITTLFLCLCLVLSQATNAQGCILKDTLFNIDFGNANYRQEFNFSTLYNYRRDFTTCPLDGFFSYAPHTSDCFNGDWIKLDEDHTPNDLEGRMMLVNASEVPSVFFNIKLAGFEDNTVYKFQRWMLNLCRPNGACFPLPANIRINFEDVNGTVVVDFSSGLLPQIEDAHWRRYIAYFTTPVNAETLFLKMYDISSGNCGNDFAVDDITIQKCYPPDPVVVAAPVKEVKPNVVKAEVEKTVTQPKVASKDTTKVTRLQLPRAEISEPDVKPLPINISIPGPLRTRDNPVVKTIEVPEGDILIQLYDNGEIDGDTVSIYHNNELIISKKVLSAKAITLHITVDATHSHHELVMVAENLGSIPPNTSLMILTAKDKRYEVFISSTEQKNAKLVIDLKK